MTGRPETDLPALNVGLVGDLACTPKVDKNFRGALCHLTRRVSHTQGISGCPGRIARFFRDSPRKQGQTPLHPTCPGKKSKYFRDRPPRRDTLSPESSDKDLFYSVKINFNIMTLSPYYTLYHIFPRITRAKRIFNEKERNFFLSSPFIRIANCKACCRIRRRPEADRDFPAR